MIIYIAGYGRSGSTLLDIVLSNADNGKTLGEICNIFNELNNVSDPYFSRIFNETIKELNLSDNELNKLQKADKLPVYFNSKYTLFWNTFLNKIVSSDTNFIVDSSKTTWSSLFRPQNLTKAGFKTKIIFLKASYIKVWKSTLKGSNKLLEKKQVNKKKHYVFAFKSILSKFLIDFFTRILYVNKNNKVVTIEYDNFINDPFNTVKMISEKFQANFSGLYEKIEQNEFEVKGGYLGNRMRKENSIIKIKKKL